MTTCLSAPVAGRPNSGPEYSITHPWSTVKGTALWHSDGQMGTPFFRSTAAFWLLRKTTILSDLSMILIAGLSLRSGKTCSDEGYWRNAWADKSAQSAGHHADYVLFDTWLSSHAQLIAVKDLEFDSIAMIKMSSCIYYEYKGEQLSVKRSSTSVKNAPDAADICFL